MTGPPADGPPATGPLASLNGRRIPFAEASLPLDDALVAGGAALTERLRTFGGVPFAVEAHLARMRAGAAAAYIPLPADFDRAGGEIAAVVRHNYELCGPGEELGVGAFLSAGSPGGGAVFGVHTSVIEPGRFSADYRNGVRLVVPATRQIPAACLSPHVKTRSRLHWRIAAEQAKAIDPAARPLLLHLDETVAECDVGNVLAVRGRTLISPPAGGILGGVTAAVTRELAAELGFAWEERPLTVPELCDGDECLLAGTTAVLLPVVRVDGAAVGSGRPGPAFAGLRGRWERHVGAELR